MGYEWFRKWIMTFYRFMAKDFGCVINKSKEMQKGELNVGLRGDRQYKSANGTLLLLKNFN